MKKNNFVHWFIICTFVTLYFAVSLISSIHVIDFFQLTNPSWLSIALSIAFEVGAAASLASLIVLNKMNKTLVWFLFILLTLFQMMGNAYFAYSHIQNYHQWAELFGLSDEDPISQKRILSIISGAILPLVALGFIKSLVDYIKPDETETPKEIAKNNPIEEPLIVNENKIQEPIIEENNKPEIIPIEDAFNIEEKPEIGDSTPGINTIEQYLGLSKTKKMNPNIRPGVN